uniref:Homeobox-containing protein n=1 Tax=Parastrongyloides trichosuri TaxID=131310 RepID=A0A0N4ZW73_PARTI
MLPSNQDHNQRHITNFEDTYGSMGQKSYIMSNMCNQVLNMNNSYDEYGNVNNYIHQPQTYNDIYKTENINNHEKEQFIFNHFEPVNKSSHFLSIPVEEMIYDNTNNDYFRQSNNSADISTYMGQNLNCYTDSSHYYKKSHTDNNWINNIDDRDLYTGLQSFSLEDTMKYYDPNCEMIFECKNSSKYFPNIF